MAGELECAGRDAFTLESGSALKNKKASHCEAFLLGKLAPELGLEPRTP